MCVAKSNERKVWNRQGMENKVLFLICGGKVFTGEKNQTQTSDIMKISNNE